MTFPLAAYAVLLALTVLWAALWRYRLRPASLARRACREQQRRLARPHPVIVASTEDMLLLVWRQGERYSEQEQDADWPGGRR